LRVLILEDNEERRKLFKRGLIGHEVSIVETAADAIQALNDAVWEIAFFDHDLAQQAYMPSGSGTGYEVAEWLSKNKDRMPARVYVHSYNEKGRKNMLEVLPEAVEAKGAWLELDRYLNGSEEAPAQEEEPGMRMQGGLWVPEG
jgi:CheY-like chemotaxis protein